MPRPTNPDPLKECRGKTHYTTKGRARDAARRAPVKIRIYRCRFCDGFHLTSKVDR